MRGFSPFKGLARRYAHRYKERQQTTRHGKQREALAVIIYQANKRQFLKDTFTATIEQNIEDVLAQQYCTLKTRGMKGCYVWCADATLAEYLIQRLGAPAVPVVCLEFSAGSFSEPQALEDGATDWLELQERVRPLPGLFVAQVVGESMNKRIPNGTRCLFRATPRARATAGSWRCNTAHQCPGNGRLFTIKRYRSKRVMNADGGPRGLN